MLLVGGAEPQTFAAAAQKPWRRHCKNTIILETNVDLCGYVEQCCKGQYDSLGPGLNHSSRPILYYIS